ncbi:MAG: FAD-binding oxidoreductase [Alphaproteobacteria bacterium]
MTATQKHVVVIGAGAVGTISALELLRQGFSVTIVDPGPPGGEQAASYGNAGWFSSHSVIPPAEPGAWKKVPKYLKDPLGPLAIRWSYLPRVVPWLLRYLWSGWTRDKVLTTAKGLRPLLYDAPRLHAGLAEEAGVSSLVERAGVMHVYPSRAAFEAESASWSIRREVGISWLELSADEIRQREPNLDPRYTFAVLVEEAGRCLDPGAYVAALNALAIERGAQLVTAAATGLKLQGDQLIAVETSEGEIACDQAVLAAGARSKALAASIGDDLPLETERGYHVMVESVDLALRTTFMASDAKMVVNPMAQGLRGAGQVEFAGLDGAPNWERARILRDHVVSMFPELPRDLDPDRVKVWMGHRPSMPDGRPCIGYARRSRDVIYAFGHGHIGLVTSARTGRVVAQLARGQEPEIPMTPFDPARFY